MLFCHPGQLQGLAQKSLSLHRSLLVTTQELPLPSNNPWPLVNSKLHLENKKHLAKDNGLPETGEDQLLCGCL